MVAVFVPVLVFFLLLSHLCELVACRKMVQNRRTRAPYLHSISISYVCKVFKFKHLDMLWMGIWVSTLIPCPRFRFGPQQHKHGHQLNGHVIRVVKIDVLNSVTYLWGFAKKELLRGRRPIILKQETSIEIN